MWKKGFNAEATLNTWWLRAQRETPLKQHETEQYLYLLKTHISVPGDASHNFCSNNQAEVYSLVPLTLILTGKYISRKARKIP